MSKLISMNFEIVPEEKAVVSVMDRSFLYGDSVYETMRTYHGTKVFLLDRHYQRLLRSAGRIGLKIPFAEQKLGEHLVKCAVEAKNPDAYLRVVVSRGTDHRFSLLPAADLKATTVIFVDQLPDYPKTCYEDGISAALVAVRRNHPQAMDPNIKTGNYMNNMLALLDADRQGAREAIMLNHDGLVTEATTSNVFMVKGGVVMTPEVQSGLLEGVSRGLIKEILVREKISFEERAIPEDLFVSADELFITGSIKEIMPVTTLDGKKIGSGRPGPLTQRLMGLWRREVERLISTI